MSVRTSALETSHMASEPKPKLIPNLKSVLGDVPQISTTGIANLPRGARIIRIGTKKPDSLGTIIGSSPKTILSPTAPRINPSGPPLLRPNRSLTYNDQVEWSVDEDGSDIAVFHSTRYPNHVFKFFVPDRHDGDQFAYCMQCLDVNRRRSEMQQTLLDQPKIQIIGKKWMENPDFPKKSHVCMGGQGAGVLTSSKEQLPDTTNLKVIRFKSNTVGPLLRTASQSSGPYKTMPGGRIIPQRGRFMINNYKLRFSVDAMKILKDTPGGLYIIEEMVAADGDASRVQNRVRLSLVRIMTEYLMQNCIRPGFPTTNERITYTQMFLAQLPVTFDVLPFSRPKGFIDKRIKRLRHSLSSRKRINGNVPMPLVLASQQSGRGSTSRRRAAKSDESDEDDEDELDSMDNSSNEGEEEEENREDGEFDASQGLNLAALSGLHEAEEYTGEEVEEEEPDVDGSTNNLLLNVIEDQIKSEQVGTEDPDEIVEVPVESIPVLKKEKPDKEDLGDLIIESPKPSTSKSVPTFMTINQNGKSKRVVIVRATGSQLENLPKVSNSHFPPTPSYVPLVGHQKRDFLGRRAFLEQVKRSSPENYVARYMERYPKIFETNQSIHAEFNHICPQIHQNENGGFTKSWKTFWMKRILTYVKSLKIDEILDLDESTDEDTMSRHAFDQLLFVFMNKQREYFRDHLWKIVLKCNHITDLSKFFDETTTIEHPIIVQINRGSVSHYFIVCDKELLPVEGKFTEALQLLVELYAIFGMDYPWEYVRWFQFFEYVYGIRPPATLENRKLFDALRAVSAK
ncbi:hypothetical protein L596_021326 [Steinernema carpocapsae]|uniref:Uncharacterized protein n=1 Tax=Steinernema carpocapsae TaxID=34508 RepID=A0A4U5MIF4_STECR|nr:hypothetical protein L596_021326 [Steinernema carpocapsae]